MISLFVLREPWTTPVAADVRKKDIRTTHLLSMSINKRLPVTIENQLWLVIRAQCQANITIISLGPTEIITLIRYFLLKLSLKSSLL